MEITQGTVEIGLIALGALLGAFKGVMAYDQGKPFCSKCVDTGLGTFVGIVLAKHYASEWNMWYAAVLAVVAGASGAMVVDVVLRLIPSVTKDIMKAWAQRFLVPT